MEALRNQMASQSKKKIATTQWKTISIEPPNFSQDDFEICMYPSPQALISLNTNYLAAHPTLLEIEQ